MKILIIEDNEIKRSHIYKLVDSKGHTFSAEHAASYQSGLKRLLDGTPFDLVILDMTLNPYDANDGINLTPPLPFGGELILREAKRKKIKGKFVVLTQYDVFPRDNTTISFEELRNELMQQFPNLLCGCIRMDTRSEVWKDEISKFLG